MRYSVAALAGIVVLGVVGATIAARSRLKAAGEASAAQIVRRPAVAGAFYADDPETLRADVRQHLSRAKDAKLPGRLVGLMCAHAGYEYCGDVIAHGYKCLNGQSFDTVVIVGPSHFEWFQGAALTDADVWQTPLGTVPIDTELREELVNASPLFAVSPSAHEREHSLEVQLPFLQEVLGKFRLVPIVVWDRSEETCAAIARTLGKALDGRNALLVASSDMSHYPVYEDANRVDRAILAAIETFDVARVLAADRELMGEGTRNLDCTLCGIAPVLIVMDAARRLGADTATGLTYANSGDAVAATRGRCVGYGSVAFCEQQLTSAQRRQLLHIARRTLEVYTAERKRPAAGTTDPALTRPSAAFVTLRKQGMLRGCIGCFEPDAPLAEQVQKMAIEAATRDPRFRPVRPEELKDIEITIEVLSPIWPVESTEQIRVGEHGVIVSQGLRHGVYLPSVATEQGWSREEMLTSLCREKAGLRPDAWRHGAQLFVFTTEHFSEGELGREQGPAGNEL